MPRILIDPLYTQRPRVCSSSYLAWQLVEALTKWRPDVYISLVVPLDSCEQEDFDFFDAQPGRERVTLVDIFTNRTDRTSELYMLRAGYHEVLHPLSRDHWDIDVVISSRIPVIKHMVVHSNRPGSAKMRSPRMFIGMEDVPCLPFRDTVAWHDHLYVDTLTSYALADAVILNGMWTKKLLRPVLREVLSPAYQKKVLDNLYEANSVKLERLRMGRSYTQGEDFNIGFVGRITATRNFNDVAEIFRNQFSYPLGPNKKHIKFGISTNSQSSGAGDPGEIDFIDLQMNDRPKFYEFLDKQHLVLNLSSVEDFSMSTYETLLHGVPMIVYAQPWTELLGPDYPFRVKNEVEVYAAINRFTTNYEQEYAKFVAWEATWWAAAVASPIWNVTTGEKVIQLIEDFEVRRREAYKHQGVSMRERLLPYTHDQTLNLNDFVFDGLSKDSKTTSLSLGRVPSSLVWKMVAYSLGYKDTMTTGVMTKD